MQKLLHNTIFQYINYTWMLLLGLFLPPYIIHYLGIREFGVWALIMTVARYFELLDLGIETTVIKRMAEHNTKKEFSALNEMLSTAFTFQILLAVSVIGATLLFLSFISDDTPYLGSITKYKYAVFVAVTVGVLRNIFVINRGILMGLQKMKVSNSIDVGATIPYIGLIILCFTNGLGLDGLITCYGIMIMISGGGMAWAARNAIPEVSLNIIHVKRGSLKALLSFGMKLQVSRLSQLASFQLDKLLLAFFLNVTYVGMYDIGAKIVTIMRNFPLIMVSAISPAVSEMHAQGDMKSITLLYKKGYLNLVACGLPFMLFSLVFANELVFAWIGENFADAVFCIRVLAVGYFLNMASGMASATAIGMGRPELEMRAGVVTLCINPILSVAGIALFGFPGAVVASAFSLSVGAVYMLTLFQSIIRCTMKESLKIFLLPLFFALFSVAVVATAKPFLFPDVLSSPWTSRYFVLSGLCAYGLIYYIGLRSVGHIASIKETLRLVRTPQTD